MDSYPAELLAEPKPLVYIVGNLENEPDVQGRIARSIEETLREAEGIALSVGGSQGGSNGNTSAGTPSGLSNSKLISNLTSSTSGVSAESLPPIDIRNVPSSYQFYLSKKKNRKGGSGSSGSDLMATAATEGLGTPSPAPIPASVTSLSPLAGMTSPLLSSNSNREAPNVQGLFKANWIHKHVNLLPSVTILTVSFNVDCTSNEWLRRENAVYEKYLSLKGTLSLRDNCKVIVVAVNSSSSGSLDKETLDERVVAFKRRLTLDSRTFCLLSNSSPHQSELQAFHPIIRRLCKTVREFSCNYYNSLLKSLKGKEKIPSSLKGTALEGVLLSRYNFKMGFIYEILGQRALAIKCYKNSLNKHLIPLAKEVDEELVTQVKIFGEWTHVKVVSLLFLTNQIKDATTHFKLYLAALLKVFCLLPYTHYKWLTQQYFVYALLLEKFAVQDPTNESEISYFYTLAAKYCQSQQSSYVKLKDNKYHIGLSSSNGNLVGLSDYDLSSPSIQHVEDTNYTANSSLNGCLVNNSYILLNRHKIKLVASPYVGGDFLVYSNPVSNSNSGANNLSEIAAYEEKEIVLKYFYSEEEKQVEHSKLILRYLTHAQRTLNPVYRRRGGFICYMIAEQQMIDLNYNDALVNYKEFIDILSQEKWFTNTIPILRKVMLCTYYLGYLTDYLSAALRLYAFSNQNFLSFYEKIELTNDILIAINSTKGKPISKCLILDIDNNSSSSGGNSRPSGESTKGRFTPDSSFDSGDALSGHSSLYGSASLKLNDRGKIEYQLPDNYSINLLDFNHPDRTNNFNLFELAIKFSKFDCYIGEKVKVELKIKSNFNCKMRFSELCVVFSKSILNRTFVGKTDTLPSSTSANDDKICVSNLDVDPGAVLTLDFQIEITEACIPHMLDNVVCVEKILLNFPAAADSGGRSVTFVAPSNHALFDTLRSKTLKVATIRDMHSCLQSEFKPRRLIYLTNICNSILTVAKPVPEVKLVAPPAVGGSGEPPLLTLLQGPVQRVDLLFTSGTCVKAGRVYLQIDSTPNSPSAAFFWYPLAAANTSPNDAAALDAVPFHPIALNSLMQPAHPLLLPSFIEKNSSFSIPLFLRSEQHGSFKIKVTLEYISRSDFTSPTSKDFIINATFDRPLKMAYSVSSTKDCDLGITKHGSAAMICRGDLLGLSATLSCINSLDGEVEVVGMTIHTTDIERGSEKDCSSKELAIFELLEGGTSSDLLMKSNGTGQVSLKKGEIIVGNTDIQCNELKDQSDDARDYSADNSASSTVTTSIGAIFVDWRLKDYTLLKAYNPATSNLTRDFFASYPYAGSSSSDWLLVVDTSIRVEPASEHPSQAASRIASIGGLDLDVVASRVCGMVFGVPAVQVVSPPFNVLVDAPAVASIGTPFSVVIDIISKLSSLEQVKISTDLNRCKESNSNPKDNGGLVIDETAFIVTGFAESTVFLMPFESVKIEFCVTPLHRGRLLLPRIRATWAKNEACIVAFGGADSSYSVFVQ